MTIDFINGSLQYLLTVAAIFIQRFGENSVLLNYKNYSKQQSLSEDTFRQEGAKAVEADLRKKN